MNWVVHGSVGTEEIVQQLRARAALPKDLG